MDRPAPGPQAGRYRFELESDDGSRLFLDGQPLISAWWLQPATTAAVEVSLVAGWHRLRIDYFIGGGPDMVQLRWSYPFGSGIHVVPADCLGRP